MQLIAARRPDLKKLCLFIAMKLAKKGVSFVVLTSEAQEVLRLCDRIYVMFHGQMRDEFSRKEATDPVERIAAAVVLPAVGTVQKDFIPIVDARNARQGELECYCGSEGIITHGLYAVQADDIVAVDHVELLELDCSRHNGEELLYPGRKLRRGKRNGKERGHCARASGIGVPKRREQLFYRPVRGNIDYEEDGGEKIRGS